MDIKDVKWAKKAEEAGAAAAASAKSRLRPLSCMWDHGVGRRARFLAEQPGTLSVEEARLSS